MNAGFIAYEIDTVSKTWMSGLLHSRVPLWSEFLVQEIELCYKRGWYSIIEVCVRNAEFFREKDLDIIRSLNEF